MGRWVAVIALVFVAGCAYVTRGEYEDAWDKDGDGWPLDQDCNDADPAVHPYAADIRGDGCDADCGTERDKDGDDWPDDTDCAPGDASIHPCQNDDVGDGVDADCSGMDGPLPPEEACTTLEDPDDPSGQKTPPSCGAAA